MRFVTIAATLLATATLAHAQEPPKKTLTVEQVILIGNGLRQLDSYQGVCRDGAIEKPCPRNYNLSAGARWTIANNMVGIDQVTKTYTKTREAMILQFAKGGTKVADEDIPRFNVEDRTILDKPSELTLARLKRDDLKLDENPIPSSVLSLIMPIVDP